MLVYFIVLSEHDIHLAASIGGGLVMVLIALFAVFLLGEELSQLTWSGILLVVVGVCLIGISKQSAIG
jgi:drug/metabolite transporter (DMT)-like permease